MYPQYPPPPNLNGSGLQVPHYVTTCYPFVQEQYYYFPSHPQQFSQRPRRPRKQRRQPNKVDVSLQCNLSNSNQSNQLPNTDLSQNNQGDPDSDSGYCSPKQRAQKSSNDSSQALDKLEQPSQLQSQTQIQSQPSYSQVVQGTKETPLRTEAPRPTPNTLSPESASVNILLTDTESLQTRRKAKKAERAQKKADLEYAEILAEEERLVKRINQTSLYNHLMDPNGFKKKGKLRENPKSKKPTPLKRVILKEREEKKQAREKVTDPVLEQNDEVPPLPPILDGIAGPDSAIQDCVEHSRIHSRRFREYCDQVIDKQIDDLAQTILTDLNRFYQRQVQRNPHKAKSKRRFVLGIREVFKHLKLGKIKCVIVSPNLEKIQSKGGLDDILSQLLHFCEENQLPIVFALGRRALGRACGKFVPVSIVGIFDQSGCEETFHKMMVLVQDARDRYQKLVGTVARDIESEKERVQEAREQQVDEQINIDKHNMNSSLGDSDGIIHQNGSQEVEEPVVENGLELSDLNKESLSVLKGLTAEAKGKFGHSRNASAASGISMCSYVSQPVSDRDWKDFVQDSEDEQQCTNHPSDLTMDDKTLVKGGLSSDLQSNIVLENGET